jgi:O-antigen/teichoic acid export membrane protein
MTGTGTPSAGAAPPPLSNQTAHPHAPLDRALVHGIAWTAAVKWLSQSLSWVTTIVVARLLMPSDYGIVGMATVFIGFTSLVTEFGIGSSILVYRDLDARRIAQLNGLSALAGVAAFALSCAAAVPLSVFYRHPQLQPVVVVLGLSFIVDSLRTVPSALLVRELRFKEVAVLEASKQLTGSVLALVLALMGWGYWALVLGNLVGSAVWTGFVLYRHWVPYLVPRVRDLRHVLGFSGRVIVERAAWYGYSESDFVVAGRVLGSTALGAYTYAWTLANIPGEKIVGLLQRVLPSIFSATQADIVALRRYFLLASEGLAFAVFPLTIGLSLVAREFILVTLGTKWIGAVVPLQFLAIFSTLRILTALGPEMLLIRGEAKYMAHMSLSALAVFPLSFYFAARAWGTVGIAAVWMLGYPLFMAGVLGKTFRVLSLPVQRYIGAVWPATSAVGVMSIAVYLMHLALGTRASNVTLLITEVLAGGITYLGVCVIFYRSRLTLLRAILRTARARPLAEAVAPT